MSSFADSVTDDMVKNIDQTYASLLSKAPKNTRLRKTQQRYRSKIQVNLIKSIKNSDWDTRLIYQVISAKLQQKGKSFQSSTADLITQFWVINETNRIRKENNLQELQYNYFLSWAAYNHADDMYRNFPNKDWETLSHTSSNGDTLKERIKRVWYVALYWAENVALNQQTVSQVMQAWMNSEWHKKNILSDSISEIGVSKVGPYWVQDFGTQRVNK